jgi:hypothetical protein
MIFISHITTAAETAEQVSVEGTFCRLCFGLLGLTPCQLPTVVTQIFHCLGSSDTMTMPPYDITVSFQILIHSPFMIIFLSHLMIVTAAEAASRNNLRSNQSKV